MSKLVKVGFILSAVALFGAGCAKSGPVAYETDSPEAITANAPEVGTVMPPGGPEAVIEYRDGAFDPPTLRVLVGTKVTFVNKGTRPVWPASGVHPTHEICPGFDARKGVKSGETYSYVFDRPAECPFHNHLKADERGTIEVKEAE
ncbi:hypothetical protein HY477_00100 [Candidatus Uhrbacteria bacterium]|nr:hypothetical protein [Candidatus Uhrbacteria bacterium]